MFIFKALYAEFKEKSLFGVKFSVLQIFREKGESQAFYLVS